jgi:hypothetical protein
MRHYQLKVESDFPFKQGIKCFYLCAAEKYFTISDIKQQKPPPRCMSRRFTWGHIKACLTFKSFLPLWWSQWRRAHARVQQRKMQTPSF